MKRTIHQLKSAPISLAICLIGGLTLAPMMAQADYRTVFVYADALGPDGTPRAHVGDTVTGVIGVINLDDFLGTMTVLTITDSVHHSTGDATTSNLLPAPVRLDSYLVFGGNYTLEVTNSYLVLPDDGDFLFDQADVQGTANFDGPNGFGSPGPFHCSVGAQVQILRPAIQVDMAAARVGGVISYSGSVSNCGNTLLTNVVVSNLVNGVSACIVGPTNLGAREVIGFTGTYLPFAPSDAPANTLHAWGTDELGLTVSNSVSAAPVLQARALAGGGIALGWSTIAGREYQVQYTTNLVEPDWKNLGSLLSVTTGWATVSDAAGTDAHRFYRLVLFP